MLFFVYDDVFVVIVYMVCGLLDDFCWVCVIGDILLFV